MPKKDKTVALLTTWLDGWYQSQVWKGVAQAARENGCRMLTLVGSIPSADRLSTGPESIFGLAGSSQVDGAVITSALLTNWEGLKAVTTLMGWLPEYPKASIGLSVPGVDSVLADGKGLDLLVKHLIVDHKCKSIAYLSGPPSNLDAAKRLDDYRAVLAEKGMVFDPLLVEYGNFTTDSGMEAVDRLLDKGAAFDALVAANDAMAMGAISALERRGKRVPEDVRVTGYDDSSEATDSNPPITTISTPTQDMAYKVALLCLEAIDSTVPPEPTTLEVAGKVIVRRSCGCTEDASAMLPKGTDEVFGRAWMVANMVIAHNGLGKGKFHEWLLERLSFASEDTVEELALLVEHVSRVTMLKYKQGGASLVCEQLISGMRLISSARQALCNKKMSEQAALVRNIHHMNNAILASSLPVKMMQNLATYSQNWCPEGMRLLLLQEDVSPVEPLDLVDRTFPLCLDIQHGNVSVDRSGKVLPEAFVPGDLWTAVPLEQGGVRYGFLLLHNWMHNAVLLEQLRLVLSSAFSISWRTRVEEKLLGTMKKQATHDELTGLYNRRGLVEAAKNLHKQALREGKSMAVLYADLDGLKKINDKHGHASGDLAIMTMAEAMKECFRDTDALSRLGGDEFAAVFMMAKESDHLIIMDRLYTKMMEHSKRLVKDWAVSASMGWATWDPAEGYLLEKSMEKADELLYADKNRRRAAGLR